MRIGKIAMISAGAYILTIKKYMLPNLDIFVPNLDLLDNNNVKNISATDSVLNAITIKLNNFSWILSFKPIYGIRIPYYVKLPFDVILSLPKLKYDIGRNIRIIPVSKLGVVIGYRIIINNVFFYA